VVWTESTMNKVACLILAHRGAPVLRTALPTYLRASWDVFVHLDRKADVSSYRQVLGPYGHSCRFIDNPLDVFWGGYSMIRAEMALIALAQSVTNYDRFILLSDDALPIRPIRDLRRLADTDLNFIQTIEQPENSPFFQRYLKFYYLDHPVTAIPGNRSVLPELDDEFFGELRQSRDGRKPATEFHSDLLSLPALDDNFFVKMQDAVDLRAHGKSAFPIYWGSQFWSLTSDVVELVQETLYGDVNLQRSFEFSAFSDELLFQSIIGGRGERDRMRSEPVYADWSAFPGPRIYDHIAEFPYDLQPSHMFLRKISPTADELLDQVGQKLENDQGLYRLTPPGPRLDLYRRKDTERAWAVVTLTAPEDSEVPAPESAKWHDLEHAGAKRFRWTGAGEIKWPIPPLPPECDSVRFVIPLHMAITDDFVGACSILFGGRSLQVTRRGWSMFSDFSVTGKERLEITLATPSPICPRQLTGARDQRFLGLAIRALDGNLT
jgi:hypothetical protein